MAKSILERLLGGDSTLGTNGLRPQVNTVAGENGVESLLGESNLDLNDGKTPTDTYKNTAPEGQSGKV